MADFVGAEVARASVERSFWFAAHEVAKGDQAARFIESGMGRVQCWKTPWHAQSGASAACAIPRRPYRRLYFPRLDQTESILRSDWNVLLQILADLLRAELAARRTRRSFARWAVSISDDERCDHPVAAHSGMLAECASLFRPTGRGSWDGGEARNCFRIRRFLLSSYASKS